MSHMLFADDTLVFCEASQDQMTYLCWTLMWFEAILGLRINLDNNELIPVGYVKMWRIWLQNLVVRLGVFLPLTWDCCWVCLLSP